MIKPEILNYEYYISKLSMFMRDSYGIKEQLAIFVDWLKSIDNFSEVIANTIDIWNEEYASEMEKYDKKGEQFKPLDYIANIVGCSRVNKIYVSKDLDGTQYDPPIEKILTLNNSELLDLIKIKIVQNNYTGSKKELRDLYQNKLDYKLIIGLTSDTSGASYQSATCLVYLDDNKTTDEHEPISDNIKYLFKYSDLFIKSLGIDYQMALVTDLDQILKLDTTYDGQLYALYPDEEDYPVQQPDDIYLG